MTLDDLEKIYGAAYWTRPELEPDGARRAGIVAVVRALRDEIADAYERGFDDAASEDWGSPRRHRSNYACAEDIIKEILGDAGEK